MLVIVLFGNHARAYDVYADYASGNWWQEIGYVGAGNPNEVLAVGEAICPNIIENESTISPSMPGNGFGYRVRFDKINSINVTRVVGQQTTVSFQLLGHAADPAYVSDIKVWARPYDGTVEGNNKSGVSNTFTYVFDYRNPVGNSNAQLLYSTSSIHSGTYTFTTQMELKGQYVLYITADLRDIDINNHSLMPPLTEQKIEMGARFTSINSVAQACDYTVDYAYNHITTVGSSVLSRHTGSVTRTNVALNNPITLHQLGKNAANGSRVLVPVRQVLYAPGDFYSKHYRIPALAKSADGSLIAISDARKYHVHDVQNDIDILSRRSTDGGKSWSNPVTIAKGSGMNASSTSCDNGLGYGDAAIATLPTGDVLVTMIYGYGLKETTYDELTQNFYCISHDNGQSWSPPKEIPRSLVNGDRGCIAPGNMLVVKNGALAGKVLACFRSAWNTPTWALGIRRETHTNYFLLYDPATDQWSRLQVNGGDSYQNSEAGDDDEAHLVEVGDNTFLMSIRSNEGSSTGREFAVITCNAQGTALSATNKGYTGLASYATNGDIISYKALLNNVETTFLINTMPRGSVGDHSGSYGTRTGLHAYYTTYNPTGNLVWNTRMCLSDPYDEDTYRKETAQYSSLTTLPDGMIGILFEEYPQVVQYEDDGTGNIMHTVFMQMRTNDLISNTVAIEQTPLSAPTITPRSNGFDCAAGGSRPNPIVITHNNNAPNVNTLYKIYVYDKNNNQIGIINSNFYGNSKTLNWNELQLNGQPLENYVTGANNSGAYLRVNAMCQADGYDNSHITTQMYLFKTPVRRLKIVARQSMGWGDPYLQSEIIGTFEQNEVMTTGVGSLVIANAAERYPFNFLGFSLDANSYTALSQAQRNALGVNEITPFQVHVTVPATSALPNNDGDCLTIYAWYENNEMGLKTRVYTNYFNSNENTPVEGASDTRNYFYNDWYPVAALAGNDFPSPSPDLIFDNVTQKGQNVAGSNLQYNLSLYKQGLDARVVVMPDSRALTYNAIVIVKNASTGGYVGRAPKRAPSNDSKYYLLQGSSAPFAPNSTVAFCATQVIPWYTTNQQGYLLPVMVDNLVFNELIPNGVASTTQGDFDIEIYVVSGNSLPSVSALDNEANYEVKISHGVRYSNDITTPVDDLGSSREVRAVHYYNAAGMHSTTPFSGVNIIVTEYTDGTRHTTKVLK